MSRLHSFARRLPPLLMLLACITSAGCGSGGGGGADGTATAAGATGEGEGSGGWTLRDTGVAELELGTTEDELKKSVGSGELAPTNPAPEGLKAPVFSVTRNGKTVLYIEMKDGKAHRMTSEDPALMTSYGAAAGTPVSQLEPLYGQGGPGKVVTVNGFPAVAFEVAPTLRFVLDKSIKARTWPDLVKEDPRVKRVQIAETWPAGS